MEKNVLMHMEIENLEDRLFLFNSNDKFYLSFILKLSFINLKDGTRTSSKSRINKQ